MAKIKDNNVKKILAVASGGGHWIQLLRLRPAFEGEVVRFMTTDTELQHDVEGKVYFVQDANMWQKLKLVRMFIQVLWVVIKFRPDVVVTTGAAPGFAAIFFGKLFGAKTIWLDSIANAEELSSSGKQAKRFADTWLTQWEHLSDESGPQFKGRIL